jgi:hypothetical protein
VTERPSPGHKPRRVTPLPIYPVVIALAFVISAYLDADVSIHAAIRPLLLVLVGSVVLTLLAVLILGPSRGPVAVTVAILVIRTGDMLHAAAAGLLLILVVAAWLLVKRIRRIPAQSPTSWLNAVSVLLLLGVGTSAVLSGAIWRLDLGQGQSFADGLTVASAPTQTLPDIYLILLDGYPREDTLQRLFDFDNVPFLDELRHRGFEVAEASSSNYMYTSMTLASMLHMAYLEDLPPESVTGTPYGVSLRAYINDNPVWARLRSLGYQIAANQAPWENVAMRDADLFCGNEVNDFELYLLRTTLVGPIVDLLDPSFQGDQHRAVIEEAFACLEQASAPTTTPKFVFIHVGGPHLPIVFTASGESAARDVFGHTAQELSVTPARFEAAYTAEVEYLNRRVLGSIDQLLQRSDQPIVIVWSDHGSESHLDWGDAAKSDLAERFSNLLAARTPSRPGLLAADVTPVNIFATLFNSYFDTDLPLLTPRHFVSPAEDKMEFSEVPDPDTKP